MDPMIERLSRLATSTLGHFVEDGFLDIAIRPVFHPVKCVGRALPVSCAPEDNTVYTRAMQHARPGDVLVVARGGDRRRAAFGGMRILDAKHKGIAGLVMDGPVTDYAELVEFRLPVFSLGISALTCRALGLGGTIGEPIVCGGVRVAPGDYVLGDDDGVLVIAPSEAPAIIERGEAATRREHETRALLDAGKTLEEIQAARRVG